MIEAALIEAIAVAWVDLGTGCPVRASLVRERLGEMLQWVVECREEEKRASGPPAPPEADLLIERPNASDEEIDRLHAERVIDLYLRG